MRTVAPGGAGAGSGCRVKAACPWPWAKAEARARNRAATNPTSISGFANQAAEFVFHALVDSAAGAFGGHADGVLDGVGVGPAVADDARAAHAQQRRAAVFGIIQALLEGGEGVLGDDVSDFAGDGGFESLAQEVLDHVAQTLADFQRDVADEAVADHHVDVAGIDVAAFDIADEVEVEVLKHGRGCVGELIAFVFLLADGEQSDARIGTVQDVARINFGHNRELAQHARRAIDVGADIHQNHGRAFGGGEDADQSGALHARDHTLDYFGGGHDGAGVARGHEALRDAIANQARGDAEGAVAFGAEGLGGAVLHGDTLAGVDNLNGELTAAVLHFELTADHILLAHQDDSDSQVPGGANRPFDFSFGGVVTAHCIHRNGQHVVPRLLLFDFDNFAAFVLPTMGADAVGQLGFVAVGALGQAGGFERIVRAAGAGPLPGVSTFGIRHISFSTNLSSSSRMYQISSLRSASRRWSWISVRQSHSASFRFLPQAGQIPLQSWPHTLCMGRASRTCSRRRSSSSMPPFS